MTANKVPPKPAKPSKDTIYVDVEDEITAVIEKIEAAKHKIVALVLPKRFTTLQSVVNMRLLKRAADKASKNVVLITSEAALLPLAGAAGLHVAKNLQSKPAIPPSPTDDKELPPALDIVDSEEVEDQPTKIDYNRSIGELAAAGEVDEPETVALDDAPAAETPAKPPPAKKSKLKVPDFDRFRLMIGLAIAGFVALILFIILALFVLPKATIAIQTTSTPLAANFDLTASGKAEKLDEEKGVIPSAVKTSDQKGSQQVPATGQQNLGQKATGSVTLKNCGNDDVTVPAGTGVVSGGLTFITQSAVSLDSGNFTPPPASKCKDSGSHVRSVNVTAQIAGSKYNIGPSSFTVSGFSGISGSSDSAMTGGTDNIVTIVSQQDVDNAKQKITSQNSDDFSKKFQSDLSNAGYYVLTSTLKLSDTSVNASPGVGQQANSTTVSTQITYSVMVIKKDDLKKAITDELNKQVNLQKQKISSDDIVKDATITVQDQKSPTDATLSVNENTTAIPIIDVASVKKQAAGHKTADIQSVISGIPGVTHVDVKFSPFWVSKAPKKESKITVKLQQVKTDTNAQP